MLLAILIAELYINSNNISIYVDVFLATVQKQNQFYKLLTLFQHTWVLLKQCFYNIYMAFKLFFYEIPNVW